MNRPNELAKPLSGKKEMHGQFYLQVKLVTTHEWAHVYISVHGLLTNADEQEILVVARAPGSKSSPMMI